MKILPAIAAIALGLMGPSCQKTQSAVELEILSNETKVVELTQKLRLLNLRWDKSVPTHHEAEATEAIANESSLLLKQLREHHNSLTAEIAKLEASLATVSAQAKQAARRATKGRKMLTLTTKTRMYEEVTITDVTDAGIQIRHRTGSTRIVCDNLSEEQITQFGLDTSSARKALEQEAKQIAAYESAETQMQLLAHKQEQQRQAIAALYKRTPVVARVSPSSTTYSRPKPVYRVVRRSSSYYQPTYYYNGYNYNTYRPTPTQVRATPQALNGPNRTNTSNNCQ